MGRTPLPGPPGPDGGRGQEAVVRQARGVRGVRDQELVAGDVVPSFRTTGEYRMQPAARPAAAPSFVSIADVSAIVRKAVGPIVAGFKGLIVDVR